MKSLEEIIGYSFNNRKLLITALSHSSYTNEKKKTVDSNERLEFLGDSILGVICAEYLYNSFAQLPEGELTKMRSSLVCELALNEYSKQINLGDFLLLGKGEEQTGGRQRPSLLADAFEALIAAIYLDAGLDTAKRFVLRFIEKAINQRESFVVFKDYKTMLQEIIQKNQSESAGYVLVSEEGPDHNKIFVSEVHLNSNVIGTGKGKTKKDAEQAAAKDALALMGIK